MDDPIDALLVDVRANTQGFRADIEAMRSTLDNGLVSGFERAGQVLERGLLSAIRNGRVGFDELKRAALSALAEIAAQAVGSGLSTAFGALAKPGSGGLFGNFFSQLAGSLLGVPGRATGGPVAPGRAYMVGERGPELFVPTSSGRVEPAVGDALRSRRDVRVSITVTSPRGSDVPTALQRSSRQVATQVRRALQDF